MRGKFSLELITSCCTVFLLMQLFVMQSFNECVDAIIKEAMCIISVMYACHQNL